MADSVTESNATTGGGRAYRTLTADKSGGRTSLLAFVTEGW